MRLDNHDYRLDAQQALNILLKRAAVVILARLQVAFLSNCDAF